MPVIMTANRKNSSLAKLSLVLGITGLLFAQTRASVLLVLAVPLGVVAAYTAWLTLRMIQRAPEAFKGRGAAMAGACCGGVSTALGLFMLVAVTPRQHHRAVNLQVENRAGDARQTEVGQPDPTRAAAVPNVQLEDFRPPERTRRDFGRRGAPFAFTSGSMPDGPVTNFTSNLPLVIIDTHRQPIYKDGDTLVSARFIDATNGTRSRINGPADYDGLGTIKLRGFSTLRLPKRSYTFHSVDAKTNQVKVPLLGLPKEEDWVLYAPYEDKTMIRDVLAYELAAKMGGYAPRTRYVELFLNTDGGPLNMRDYAGVYVLAEKIKRGKDRVNIAKLEPVLKTEPDIMGGYIIKRDHNERDEGGFYTRRGGPYYYVYPKSEEITPEQKSWLVRYLNAFEMALNSSNFADPNAGYAAYLDVDSFINAHWLIEVSKNVDGFRYSSYLTKDRGGKLKTEPPWDFNRSFGNANYYGGWQPNNWYWTYLRPSEIGWYRRLSQDPAFARRCTARWLELRKDVLNPNAVKARIDQLAAQLGEAQKRNFQRWPIMGEQVTCNYYVGNSYEDEVRWLKNWIERRIAWIDGQMESSGAKNGSAAAGAANTQMIRR